MAPSPRFTARFGFIFLGVMFGAALGAFVLAFQLADQEPKYVSVARLQAPEPASEADAAGRHWEDFYANMAYDLESGAVPRQAWERLQQRHPGLQLCDVEVEASTVARGPVIEVKAKGEEPRCVTLYLEALLESYLDYFPGDAAVGEVGEVVIVEHATTGKEESQGTVLPLLGAAHAGGVVGGMAGFLLSLCFVGKGPPRVSGEDSSSSRDIATDAVFSEVVDGSRTQPSPEAVLMRRRAMVRSVLATLVAGALAGTLVQIVRLGSTPQTFRSIAKLADLNAAEPTPQTDFHRAVGAFLESPELSRRTLERMRDRHAELRDSQVHISVRQTRGAAVFNVLAEGRDPRYTKLFLDTLLDEFMAVRDRVGNVVVQDRATAAAQNVEDWEMPLLVGSGVGGVLGAALGCLGMFLRRRASPV